ncbi:MAG: hypothetical protein RJA22_607 [Verrucomicrobiota bacterium]|jgi:hypothetical protein
MMRVPLRPGLLLAAALALPGPAPAPLRAAQPAAPSFRTNDVIALVGGEDMVTLAQHGGLETLLTLAWPGHHLRFRSLAFEGDTVFEQPRQLNFPTWEQQLERVGATVVLAQFGQAESLRGPGQVPAFTGEAGRFLDRLTRGGRRLILLGPTPLEDSPGRPGLRRAHAANWDAHAAALAGLASARSAPWIDLRRPLEEAPRAARPWTRDGLHLNAAGHWLAAVAAARQLGAAAVADRVRWEPATGALKDPAWEAVRREIMEKNRLWFDYWRPQNWAFLHGDRTDQASSRDHRDRRQRWFPAEMEQFLPLVMAREQEAWRRAAALPEVTR